MKDIAKISSIKLIDFYGMCLLVFLMPVAVVSSELMKACMGNITLLPLSILLLPLLGIILNLCLKNRSLLVRDTITVIFTVATLLHSVFMVKYIFGIEQAGELLLFHKYIPNFDLSLHVDKISLTIILVNNLFGLACSLYIYYQNKNILTKFANYGLYLLVVQFLSVGILLAGDFLTLFLFYEILSVFPFIALIFMKMNKKIAEEKDFLLSESLVGISLLIGIIFFYYFTNTLEMKNMVDVFKNSISPIIVWIMFILIFIGFFGKTNIFFQHFFVSKTKRNILLELPGSFMFSILLLQLAIYSIFRYITITFIKL